MSGARHKPPAARERNTTFFSALPPIAQRTAAMRAPTQLWPCRAMPVASALMPPQRDFRGTVHEGAHNPRGPRGEGGGTPRAAGAPAVRGADAPRQRVAEDLGPLPPRGLASPRAHQRAALPIAAQIDLPVLDGSPKWTPDTVVRPRIDTGSPDHRPRADSEPKPWAQPQQTDTSSLNP